MAPKVVVVFGTGPRIGLSTVTKFADNGWKVASVARNVKDEVKAVSALTFQNDLQDSTSVQAIFDKVTAELGVPSAVVYNVYGAEFVNPADPFVITTEKFNSDSNVNINSLYAAAKAAQAGFAKLPADVPKSFSVTGNALIHTPWLSAVTLGVGKAGAAHIVQVASKAFKGQSRWYFVDERTATGAPGGYEISGPAHAEAFYELATEGEKKAAERYWEVNFVAGQGFKYFGVEGLAGTEN